MRHALAVGALLALATLATAAGAAWGEALGAAAAAAALALLAAPARGELRLLTDGTSPLYRDDAEALRWELRRIRLLLTS